MTGLRVVQLTDCHVAGDPDASYRGIDARENLNSLLEVVRRWGPDLVLATGDLSEDAHPDSYEWLASRFYSLDVPVMAAPGNHDEVAAMAKQFAATASDAPLVFDIQGWRIVMLNSAVPGEVPGKLGDEVLGALDQLLDDPYVPAVVALHHQPLPVGSPWIDRYPLLDPDPFWRVIHRHRSVQAVIWGHVHQAQEFEVGGVRALSGPSTASNSLPGYERFTYDESGPACRWLELRGDGSLETGILRAAAAA